jgi:biopolymer transport protein ExbD
MKWWMILVGVGGLAVIAAMAMPIATLSVKVDLPPPAPAASSAPACPQISLQMRTVGEDVKLLLNGTPTTRQRLLLDLARVRRCRPDETKVAIRADHEVAYRQFMDVVSELQAGGYSTDLALVESR